MFSLQTMLEALGLPCFADKMERLAYNALPATITEDFMAHQYVQQANQVLVSKAKRNWFNNNEESNMFGLEPNFGCCTANMHQGWPKFVKSLWYRESDSEVVSMVFAPCRLETEVRERNCVSGRRQSILLKKKSRTMWRRLPMTGWNLRSSHPGWCSACKIYKNGICVKEVKNREKTGDVVSVCRGIRTGDKTKRSFPWRLKHLIGSITAWQLREAPWCMRWT